MAEVIRQNKTHDLHNQLQIRDMSTEEIMKFIEEGANINPPKDWLVLPALAVAVLNGRVGALLTLLDLGSDVDGVDNYLLGSPLSIAIEHGSIEIVKILLARGANPNGFPESIRKGTAPLFTAIHSYTTVGLESNDSQNRAFQYLQILEMLLRYGANCNAVQDRNYCGGQTPLMVAGEIWSDLAVTQLLLEYGADPFWELDGRNVVLAALTRNNKNQYHFFRSMGVRLPQRAFTAAMVGNVSKGNPNAEMHQIVLEIIKHKDFSPSYEDNQFQDKTPLMIALQYDPISNLDLVRALCARGADLNKKVGVLQQSAFTVLDIANLPIKDLKSLLTLLIELGANINMEKDATELRTPKQYLINHIIALPDRRLRNNAEEGRLEMMQWFLSKGYDVTWPMHTQELGRKSTLLMHLCRTGLSSENIDLLNLIMPLSQLSERNGGYDALHYCVDMDNFVYYQILIDAGAQPDTQSLMKLAEKVGSIMLNFSQKTLMSLFAKQNTPFHIMVLGDPNIGKTSLCDTFLKMGYTTLPLQSTTHSILWKDRDIHFQIQFEEPSQAEAAAMAQAASAAAPPSDSVHLRFKPHVILLAYSIVAPPSFHNIKTRWNEVADKLYPGVPKLLVGTREDQITYFEILRTDQLTNVPDDCPIDDSQAAALSEAIGARRYMAASWVATTNVCRIINTAIIAGLTKGCLPLDKRSNNSNRNCYLC